MQKAENGSYYAYDGADALGPQLTTAYQITPSAQITGTRSGFAYWNGAVVWVTPLQKNIHVNGNVKITAYMSSTTGGFSLFSGGGYGMGLVDIDENGNELKEFIVEASPSIGANPFTATPKAYSLNTNIDYVFNKGHYLGFFVGAGATIQGYTFTVYFDSQDRNSGATVPIEDPTETYKFNPVWGGETYDIEVTSNSALTNFELNAPEKEISYDAWGIRGTSGYSSAVIPKDFLTGPFEVFVDDQQVTPTTTENTTHTTVYFTYTHDPNTISIIGSTMLSQQLNFVTIVPSSKTLQVGTTQEFSAEGYDQNNNPISDLTFTWTVTGDIGSVNPTSGKTTIFTSSKAGNGAVSATTTYEAETKSASASVTATTTQTEPDTTPPTITHTPITTANHHQTVTISAKIVDNNAVTEAKLYYKESTQKIYTAITMTPNGNTFTGVIPASAVTSTGVEYYIYATDGTKYATHPANNPTTQPHNIAVTLVNMPPTASTLNNPTEITQNSMKLTWTQNSEADFAKYIIYQSETSKTLGTEIHTITDRSTTSYTATQLSENTTYYFTLRTIDTAGFSADSAQVTGKTNHSGVELPPIWVLWTIGGVAAIAAALTITLLLLKQRRK